MQRFLTYKQLQTIQTRKRSHVLINLHSNEPLNPAQQNICNELRQNECHGQHSRPLDFLITEREVRNAAEKLKNNKSPFSDKIRNEMIKASIDTHDACIWKII